MSENPPFALFLAFAILVEMKIAPSILLLTALLFQNGHAAKACATDVPVAQKKKHTSADWNRYWLAHQGKKLKSNRGLASEDTPLPDATSAEPWGGSDATKWAPEAILANAVSHALNEGYARANVKDVLVSVPVKMLNSSIRPYFDGQTNASLNFGSDWNESAPQLVATLITLNSGESVVRFRLHSHLQFTSNSLTLQYSTGDGHVQTVTVPGKRETDTHDFVAEWHPDSDRAPIWGDLFQNHVAFVKPSDWKDWFAFDFRNVVKSNAALLAELPDSWKKLGSGSMIDPENISVQGKDTDLVPFQTAKMKDANFGKDINGERYFPVDGPGIHNQFDLNGNTVYTAVGHGNTLVMKNAPSPFKSAYICFDERNPGDETTHHVPSGGGWHEIGDFAETVLNSLEKAPVVFGYANGAPVAHPPSGKFNWSLNDVVVVRKLKPGDALITAAGLTTRHEEDTNTRGGKESSGRNYHWFIFNQPTPVCAVEWVHPCVPGPNNHDGMVCN